MTCSLDELESRSHNLASAGPTERTTLLRDLLRHVSQSPAVPASSELPATLAKAISRYELRDIRLLKDISVRVEGMAWPSFMALLAKSARKNIVRTDIDGAERVVESLSAIAECLRCQAASFQGSYGEAQYRDLLVKVLAECKPALSTAALAEFFKPRLGATDWPSDHETPWDNAATNHLWRARVVTDSDRADLLSLKVPEVDAVIARRTDTPSWVGEVLHRRYAGLPKLLRRIVLPSESIASQFLAEQDFEGIVGLTWNIHRLSPSTRTLVARTCLSAFPRLQTLGLSEFEESLVARTVYEILGEPAAHALLDLASEPIYIGVARAWRYRMDRSVAERIARHKNRRIRRLLLCLNWDFSLPRVTPRMRDVLLDHILDMMAADRYRYHRAAAEDYREFLAGDDWEGTPLSIEFWPAIESTILLSDSTQAEAFAPSAVEGSLP